MVGIWWAVARAQDVPEPAPEVIEIAPTADVLPSAITEIAVAHETSVDIVPQLSDWLPLAGKVVRGKPIVRPLLGLAVHGPRGAMRVGGMVGHQWWTMQVREVQLGGESRLELTAPVGGARGHRLDLGTQAGPWLGPVGLRVGPQLRWDREQWGDEELPTTLSLGGGLDLSTVLGPLALTAGVEPMWSVSGARPDAAGGVLPSLGVETTWRAGIGTTGRPLQLAVEVADRETALGSIVEVGASISVRVF